MKKCSIFLLVLTMFVGSELGAMSSASDASSGEAVRQPYPAAPKPAPAPAARGGAFYAGSDKAKGIFEKVQTNLETVQTNLETVYHHFQEGMEYLNKVKNLVNTAKKNHKDAQTNATGN